MASLALFSAFPGHALPTGRAWARTEALAYPRIAQFSSPRFEVDSTGTPYLIAVALWDTAETFDWSFLTWADSAWRPPILGYVRAGMFPVPVLSADSKRYLAWLTVELGPPYLYMSEIRDDWSVVQDTVARTTPQSYEYTAAASTRRRWLARSQSNAPFQARVRMFYADTVGMWHELETLGVDEDHCSLAPLSDTTAILAMAGVSGLTWAKLEGTRWTESGSLDPNRWWSRHPRFRFKPSGGLWLIWTEARDVHISSYEDGQWTRGDSTQGVHQPGETFTPGWCDASRDTAEKPVIVWGDLGYGYTYRDVACISFPTDSGWTPGEEIPGSADGIDPKVTRDRNGDAWVAWSPRWAFGTRFIHTYVAATTSAPRFEGSGREPIVSWTLSEPAPESWWAVLRAAGAGEFEPVARVRAGNDLALRWTDAAAPQGAVLRYRIRRESVDTRYQWLSEEATWFPRGAELALGLRSAHPSRARIELAILGAEAGDLMLRLYDLQGRVVYRQLARAEGSGQDSILIGLAAATPPIRPGVYFARVADSRGRASPALKLVILDQE